MVGRGARGDTRDGLIQPDHPETGVPMIPARLSRLLRYPVAAAIVATLDGSSIGAIPVAAVTTYSTDTPMILTNVSPEDLWANVRGVCNGSFNIVVRNVLGASNALNYLNAAQHCHLKAVLFFQSTVSGGGLSPSPGRSLPPGPIKHPAPYAHFSVQEPFLARIPRNANRFPFTPLPPAG